ncbi:hypothetical protein Mmah_0296 [Methanohalophilus mahii DSM 5219]|uniref:Uncharacterized protein n=1 Tax=Methanohalophilus mahii (strain ATCC 35705 / DSM 5219 / SLP) TaxID=547558 RepID=D5E9H7_METMS|nr:hypothetical protein Mmah_0296 [Methanohalophilus mahii DSM 5219]
MTITIITRTHLIEIIKHLDSRRNHVGSVSND